MNKLLIFSLLIILNSSCLNSKSVETKSKSVDYQWGVRWYQTDSTGNHFKGISADRNCFPGFEQSENNYKEIAIEIFDRWGELQYSSISISENWICNDDNNSTFNKGSYFYRLIMETTKNPSVKDTATGELIIY